MHAPIELWITERDCERQAVKIWPAAVELGAAQIQEARAYVIEARGRNTAVCDLLIDDVPLLALRAVGPDIARWLWEPGFYAGEIDFSLMRSGRSVCSGNVTVDPSVAKLMRQQFDRMVTDIVADTFALISWSPARKGFAKGGGAFCPPQVVLEFLRIRLSTIIDAVERIMSQPVRLLASERRPIKPTEYASCRSVDLSRAFRTSQYLTLGGGHPLVRLTPHKTGWFPAVIKGSRRTPSVDIAEHRAVKTELRRIVLWLTIVQKSLSRAVRDEDRSDSRAHVAVWVRRCEGMTSQISELLAQPFFKEIGDTPSPLSPTPLFRISPAYSKFFRTCRDMRQGLARVAGDFVNMSLSQTFDLYELWVFLRLARAAFMLFQTRCVDLNLLLADPASESAVVHQKTRSTRFLLGRGVVLCFKPQYQEYWRQEPTGCLLGSYSRTMIPDMSFEITEDLGTEATKVIVLDAKYRLDSKLGEAITSLHTYVDAIVRAAEGKDLPKKAVKAAFVVTPSKIDSDWSLKKVPWPKLSGPNVFFHPEYRKLFRFGAVSLSPGTTLSDAIQTLKQILVDAEVNIDDAEPGQVV